MYSTLFNLNTHLFSFRLCYKFVSRVQFTTQITRQKKFPLKVSKEYDVISKLSLSIHELFAERSTKILTSYAFCTKQKTQQPPLQIRGLCEINSPAAEISDSGW